MTDESATRVQTAGIGLSAGSIAWGRRPPTPRAIELTDRDRSLLSTLLDLGYLTTSMLGLLFWGTESAAVHRRLKLLHDVGYIDKLRPRVRATEASREWIYRLSAQGWRDVVSHDPRWSDHSYRPTDVQAISYLEHDVQVNGLITHLAALAVRERRTDRPGGLIDRVPFEILGPRRGVLVPAPLPSSATASDTGDVRLGRAISGTLAPDVTFVGVDALGRRTAVLIEYDRTRRGHKQIRKLRRYDHFLTTGWRASRFADHDLEPLVLFVCVSDQQLRSFLDTANRNLTAWRRLSDGFSNTGEHPGRGQIAFTSRARLLARDWHMLQVPPRPGSPRPCYLSAELALPALFHPRDRIPQDGTHDTGGQ